MHQRAFVLAACLLSSAPACAPSTIVYEAKAPVTEVNHASFSALLARFVKNGVVDLEAWHASSASRHALRDYIGTLTHATPDARPELFHGTEDGTAYWINLSNAMVIEVLLDHWPVKSIDEITPTAMAAVRQSGGLFDESRFELMDRVSTLAEVTRMVKTRSKDPRVAFALACGAVSCPPFRKEAFVGDELDHQLDDAIAKVLSDTRYVGVDDVRKTVSLPPFVAAWEPELRAEYKRQKQENPKGVVTALLSHAHGLGLENLTRAEAGGYAVVYRDFDGALAR